MLNLRATRLVPPGLQILVMALGSGLGCKAGTEPPLSIASRLELVTAPGLTAQSGVLLSPQPVLELRDAQGNAVAEAGRLVTAILATPGGTLTGTVQIHTTGTGRAAFTNLAITGLVGAWRLRFDSPGLQSFTSEPIQVAAGTAALMAPESVSLQTGVAGAAVAIPPSVRVTDGAGNPVAGVAVTFAPSAGGSVQGSPATTNASGIAALTGWTLSTVVGLNTLTASSAALPGASVGFTATGILGPPATLTLVAGEGQNAAVGGDTPVAPAVKVTDAVGHPLPSVAVTFAAASGGGSVTGGTALTDANGIATVGSWTVGLVPGPNTLTASRSGVSPITFHATGVAFSALGVAAGNGHSCALDPLGTAYCWGINALSQLGNGGALTANVPTLVSGALVFASIAAGDGHSCGVLANGDAFCWGANDSGQLGDGTQIRRATPAAVAGGFKFSVVLPSAGFTCGLLLDATTRCWGFGQNGQMGDGGTTTHLLPTAVIGGHLFTRLSTGGSHVCGIEAAIIFCWGFNGNGRLGDGTTTLRTQPTAVSGNLTFSEVSAGSAHTCGITTAGAGFCWGAGGSGRLGNGAVTDQLSPFPVAGVLLFSAISASGGQTCALTTTALAYCWGANGFGQLGDGTFTNRNVPTAVVGGLTYASIAGGVEHTCGRSVAGGVYCWGRNDATASAVGDGTVIVRQTPVGAVRP